MSNRRSVRIGNMSGYYGDRPSAAQEMLDGGPVDVVCGDYLAELTMVILDRDRRRSGGGYARTFLAHAEAVLGQCLDRNIKIVVNAGGLNPSGLAAELHELAKKLGLAPKVSWLEGDDLVERVPDLLTRANGFRHLDTGEAFEPEKHRLVAANAYLGAWGIVEALEAGADIVICPRVTDASLVVGPAAWWHGWRRTDWDQLAGAVVAGHVIECGTQATGGNYPFLDELEPGSPGFPIAEVAADGSSIITKHAGTPGGVTVGTVTAQLVYEIGSPDYLNPDVVSRFDALKVEVVDKNRVQITGATGYPPPPTLKVGLIAEGGHTNSMSMVFTGLDIERKIEIAEERLFDRLGRCDQFAEVRRTRLDAIQGNVPIVIHTITVRSMDATLVGRRFSNAVTETALASYAGFFCTTPPTAATPVSIFWPTLVPAAEVTHVVALPDGSRRIVEPSPSASAPPRTEAVAGPPVEFGPSDRAPLGTVCGARSGDKAGKANVGVWAFDRAGFAWLEQFLTVDRLRSLVVDAGDRTIRRWTLPGVHALNFEIEGLLGMGVSETSRFDPQAKGLGEMVRAAVVDIPLDLGRRSVSR